MNRYLSAIAVAFALWAGPASAAALGIIGADALPDYIKKNNPVIVVATGGPGEGTLGYLTGAVAENELTWAGYSATQTQIDDLGAWGTHIGDLGIDGTRPVLVYDDGGLKFASRIRYLLAHYGVKTALLVNGGWAAIQPLVDAKKLTAQSNPSVALITRYTARAVQPPIPIVPRKEVRAIVIPRTVLTVTLIDVRTPDEYTGKTVLKPGEKPGHIPGAINLPIADLFTTPTSTMLQAPEALARTFKAHGINPNTRLIFYCQDGARSSLGALAAKEAGFPRADLYYLSFLDWQSDPKDPIVTGPRPY
ncbi:MAG TPA: rhodanese-like domain-containing protein [Rhizomicrobium sp.]|jgi:thiosulfate/3-mercaptopyruvate sulfurtransferase|nr:rhodanese-like domain-containing protein [Rhizomicrobium sp.]